MKKWVILPFLAFPIFVFSQTTVVWGDSMVVTSTGLPVTAPHINFLPDGTPLMTWGESSNNPQIWCSRFENGGFSAPVGVVQPPAQPNMFGFGGYDVAVSDTQVFVVFEQPSSGIWLSRSDDEGLHFNQPIQVQGPISGSGVTIASLTVDGTGNPIVSYIQIKNKATYQVRRSPDGGETWGDPVTANTPASGGEVCECCNADLLASGDSIWIVFRNNNQNLRDIWVSRSTDLAASFDIATDVDNTDWQVNVCPISGPHIARSGDSILTVWMSKASGESRVYCSALHAGTMEAGQQIDFPSIFGPATAQTFPEIAAAGDTVGVVFLEKSREIVFYHSIDGITKLNAQPQRFSLPDHTFQFPSLAYGDGVFHLIYTDATADKVLYRRGILTHSSSTTEPADSNIAVFPNPVNKDFFWVKCGQDELETVSVFDVFGKLMLTQKLNGNTAKVRLEGISSGLYFLKIKASKGEVVRKFIKK